MLKSRRLDSLLAIAACGGWAVRGFIILAQITEDKLGKVNCGDKAEFYRALWYLGDTSAADAMIKGYKNLLCTNQHFNFISDESLGKVSLKNRSKSSFSVESVSPKLQTRKPSSSFRTTAIATIRW